MNRVLIKFENARGSAFALIIIAMAVVFLLVSGLITVSTSENIQSLYQSDETKAYYIARAGAESMAEEMKRIDFTKLSEFSTPKTATADTSIFNGTGEVTVTVEQVGLEGNYRITSVGDYNGHSETVKIFMSYNIKTDIDYAVYSIDEMYDDGPNTDIEVGTIVGDLVSGGDIDTADNDPGLSNATVIPFQTIDIDITLPSTTAVTYFHPDGTPYSYGTYSYGVNETIIKSTKIDSLYTLNGSNLNPMKINYEFDTDGAEYIMDPDDSDSPDNNSTVPGDGMFSMVEYDGSNPNHLGREKWLIVYFLEETSIDSQTNSPSSFGPITVTGSNNLMIIVKDGIHIAGKISMTNNNFLRMYILDNPDTVETHSELEAGSGDDYDFSLEGNTEIGLNGSPEKFTIIVDGVNRMRIDNNNKMYAKIVAPESTIDLKNGSTEIYGTLYAEDITFDAGPSIYYQASSTTIFSITKVMDIDHWEE